MNTFDYRIAGIPCKIEVLQCNRTKGTFSYHASSDLEYYGEAEVEFRVLDRKGYKANWLAKKMSEHEHEEICELILENI